MTSRSSGAGRAGRGIALAAGLAAAVLAAGCRQDMHDAPRYEPLERSTFYADSRASRPIPEGTVARGFLRDNDAFYTGMVDGAPVEKIPMAVTREVVERGRERFNIYCSPCHGLTGEGNGMIVQRGYRRPASYHDPRLRSAQAGYFFDVMTRGFGQMPDYAAQVSPEDRWAIVAYIRALQLSQGATVDDVPPADRSKLDQPAEAQQPQGATTHD
ncbi:MAG TPA: cytochrome c [Vicinamibacterales bacterium]